MIRVNIFFLFQKVIQVINIFMIKFKDFGDFYILGYMDECLYLVDYLWKGFKQVVLFFDNML